MISVAQLSPCLTWRWSLERTWDLAGPLVLFVGLNPSTADAEANDPTIRRCIRFARDWGYGGLLMGNLFAFRATDPAVMAAAADPVGPHNDESLRVLASRARIVVAAWGAHKLAVDRARSARFLLGPHLYALGVTKHGAPRHPLYMRATCSPRRWSPA